MSDKISPQHLARKAIVYIRQSSTYQVSHNLESQRLQYAMQDRLRHLGWQEIEVVDEDLGRSAAGMVTLGSLPGDAGEGVGNGDGLGRWERLGKGKPPWGENAAVGSLPPEERRQITTPSTDEVSRMLAISPISTRVNRPRVPAMPDSSLGGRKGSTQPQGVIASADDAAVVPQRPLNRTANLPGSPAGWFSD